MNIKGPSFGHKLGTKVLKLFKERSIVLAGGPCHEIQRPPIGHNVGIKDLEALKRSGQILTKSFSISMICYGKAAPSFPC